MAASPPTLVRAVYQAALGCQLRKAKSYFLSPPCEWMDAYSISKWGERKGKERKGKERKEKREKKKK
jgi:hypothetical protein